MDVWYVCVFILCLCYPLFRYIPCNELMELITRPTFSKMIMKLKISGQGSGAHVLNSDFKFHDHFTDGRAPWTGDQLIARNVLVPKQRIT
jgi:hypothetical protein